MYRFSSEICNFLSENLLAVYLYFTGSIGNWEGNIPSVYISEILADAVESIELVNAAVGINLLDSST